MTLHWNLVAGSGDPVVVAAGDQHACDGTGDDQTAALIGPLAPTLVLPLGDESGEYGYLSEFTNCYAPTWGAFKSISRPVPGNHDYEGDQTASGYFTYWGIGGGQPGPGLVQLRPRCLAHHRPELELRARRRLRLGRPRGAVAEAGPRCAPGHVHARVLPSPALHLDPGARLQRACADDLHGALPGRRGRDRATRTPGRTSGSRRRTTSGHLDNQYGIREFVVATGGASPRQHQHPRREQPGLGGVDPRRPQADAAPDDVRLAVRAGRRRLVHRFGHGELPLAERRTCTPTRRRARRRRPSRGGSGGGIAIGHNAIEQPPRPLTH